MEQLEENILIARLNVLHAQLHNLRLAAQTTTDKERDEIGRQLLAAQNEFDLCWQALTKRGFFPVVAETGGFRLSKMLFRP